MSRYFIYWILDNFNWSSNSRRNSKCPLFKRENHHLVMSWRSASERNESTVGKDDGKVSKGESYFLYLLVTHSSRLRALFFFSLSLVLDSLFFLPPCRFFFSSMPFHARKASFSGGEQRRSAGDKSRISCSCCALAWKRRRHYRRRRCRRRRCHHYYICRGGNLSLADDPLKQICPRTSPIYRTTTREVIQRHATRSTPTRAVSDVWHDVTWCDMMWLDRTWRDAIRCNALRCDVTQSIVTIRFRGIR